MANPGIGEALERASAVAHLVQGEVLAVPDACIVVADAAYPLSDTAIACAEREGASDGLLVVPQDNVEHIVVLTQTCDLQDTTVDESRCLVAPVVVVGAALAEDALRGRRPRYVALPWLNAESVADLTLVTTVERSVIANARSVARPSTPQQKLHLAACLARNLSRPALPDHINDVLRPFAKRIRERYERNSPEAQCLQQILSLRLQAEPDVDAARPALTVLVVIEAKYLPPLPHGQEVSQERIDQLKTLDIQCVAQAVIDAKGPVAAREAWTALAELWLAPSQAELLAQPLVGSLDVEVLSGSELDFERSLNSPELDVSYLSTRPRRNVATS